MPLCCQLPSRLAHLLDLQYCLSWQPLFLRPHKWLWPRSLHIVDYNHIPESFASCWCNWRCSCFENFTILCLCLQLTSMPVLQVGQYYSVVVPSFVLTFAAQAVSVASLASRTVNLLFGSHYDVAVSTMFSHRRWGTLVLIFFLMT